MSQKLTQVRFSDMNASPVCWLAFGFGSGLAPKAPGTFGTIAALPVYLLLVSLSAWAYGITVLIFALAGIYICRKATEQLDVHDHPGIVWDEIVGLLITMWLVPFSWLSLAVGFVLFRLFDIIKPWPIKWIDRHVHGGFGIMLDDVIAAVFANLILQLLFNVTII